MKSIAAAAELASTRTEVTEVSNKRCYRKFSERQNRYIRVCDRHSKRYRHSQGYRYYRYYDYYQPYYYGYGPSVYFAFPGLNFYFSPHHRHHHRHFKKRYKHY
jgi:hypothetical protein